ncbi:CAP domain-containing protein [Yoonia vestfoldensis]|uniref:CAP domain-containing protein n=1 Tax=Yoonia vestfoldensis TaxID=245188 RepID=UPI0003775E8F|nr:CAP domain-containing protein [Yoonia vestfoldensis]
MRIHISILALGLLAGCMGSGGTGVDVVPAPSVSLVANNTLGPLLNDVRAANDADPLNFNNRLALAAQVHANDMLRNDFFSHTGSDASEVGDRVTAQGYTWSRVGENIAQGHQSEAAVMRGWTNSPGHHRNNIDPNYQDFGLGKAGSGGDLHWVLVLATPG